MEREDRIAVYEQTMKIVNEGYYVKDGKEIRIPTDDLDESLKELQHFQNGEDISGLFNEIKKEGLNPTFSSTEVEVINEDTLVAAKNLINEGMSPAILNMASYVFPGGGVLKGSAAQEENLFRRTDLFRSLYKFHDNALKLMPPVKKEEKGRYPLKLHHGGIFSPYITVFRDTDENDYQLLNEPYVVNVVSMAALRNPTLTEDGKLTKQDYEITKEKIRDILYYSYIGTNDAVVLGALGCGAYKNPPEEVARACKEVINEKQFEGCFRKIVFAIFDDHNSRKAHNPRGNFIPFKEIIEGHDNT